MYILCDYILMNNIADSEYDLMILCFWLFELFVNINYSLFPINLLSFLNLAIPYELLRTILIG